MMDYNNNINERLPDRTQQVQHLTQPEFHVANMDDDEQMGDDINNNNKLGEDEMVDSNSNSNNCNTKQLDDEILPD